MPTLNPTIRESFMLWLASRIISGDPDALDAWNTEATEIIGSREERAQWAAQLQSHHRHGTPKPEPLMTAREMEVHAIVDSIAATVTAGGDYLDDQAISLAIA